MNLSGGDWTEDDQQRYEERQKVKKIEEEIKKEVENNVKEMWEMEVRKVLALELIGEELGKIRRLMG